MTALSAIAGRSPHLADRAVMEDAPEVRAAAALAGMALGLWAS